jgi:hypothetical protein
MRLYRLPASNWQTLFGSLDAPISRELDLIAQKPDCSEWLCLSKTAYEGLEPFAGYEGYDFTYRQAWGLTINEDVVRRTISDLRRNAYPPMADYVDGLVKGNQEQVDTYLQACLAVKARYTKLEVDDG